MDHFSFCLVTPVSPVKKGLTMFFIIEYSTYFSDKLIIRLGYKGEKKNEKCPLQHLKARGNIFKLIFSPQTQNTKLFSIL